MTAEKGPPDIFAGPPEDLTPEEADRRVEEMLASLSEELQEVPEVIMREGAQRLVDFLKGDLSWAEMLNLRPETMQRIAEMGYTQLQAGRLEEAERFFKVLTMLNWQNPYFHSMLGVIYQREQRPGEAIAQYGEAITLNPQDGVSLLNRAALFLKYGWLADAERDLGQLFAIPGHEREAWGKQARMLHNRVNQLKEQRTPATASPTVHKGKDAGPRKKTHGH
ncbi:MAG: tetratricopeptide repeat protein [Deltaproteobacteria bacterium]|nr:tetratricopeptide repeat protein [Deltaproteobacteria bacterium]